MIDTLIAQIEAAERWPPDSERGTHAKVFLRRAFRQSDEVVLRRYSGWDQSPNSAKGRHYITDPLPGLISRAFADLLFGDAPTVRTVAEADQANVDDILEVNQWASELHRAERMCSSEGEVWWRIYVDKDVALRPMVQWLSRLNVVPLMHGSRVTAVAFVSVLSASEEHGWWRHVEVHADGEARNLLYAGQQDSLGTAVPLDRRMETAGLPEVWTHGLPMLAGRVVNAVDDDPTLGRSDYQGVERLLLALNEAATIGSENARLTAKKRLFITGEMVQSDGTFDAGADVIQVDQTDGKLGETGPPPVSAVEYSFDAQELIAWTQNLTDTILTRVGVAPELVGRQSANGGRIESGVALRTRMLHSVLTATGKGRYWDDALPHILALCMLVDQLPLDAGGYGRRYVQPAEPPAVDRGDVLPQDDLEDANRHATLINAELESRETAIRDLHPDWNDEQIAQELQRISADMPTVPTVGA